MFTKDLLVLNYCLNGGGGEGLGGGGETLGGSGEALGGGGREVLGGEREVLGGRDKLRIGIGFGGFVEIGVLGFNPLFGNVKIFFGSSGDGYVLRIKFSIV